MLAIEGDIGIGKTAAMIELAHRLQSHGGVGDGIPDLRDHAFVWIDGRGECPSLVSICHPLSILTADRSLLAAGDEQRLDVLRAHLAHNKTVLLLDNLRLTDDPASQQLRELLRAVPTGSLAIASLSTPGALDATRVFLSDLDASAVLELIQREAHRLGLSDAQLFDEAFARRLQAVVGGNPRMIQLFLAGAARSSWTLDERLEAIERGEGLDELLPPAWQGEQILPTVLGPDGYPVDADSPLAREAALRIRDVNAELLKRLADRPDLAYQLTPRQFEEVMAELYAGAGFDVELTRASNDGGVDLYVVSRKPTGRLLTLVDCKRYSPENRVGVGVVRQLYGVVTAEDASAGVIATTSFFTKGARTFEQERKFRITLVDYVGLRGLLRQHSPRR